ncbi:RDD family protein [Microbulbifer sp. ANSA001]|uniref:RDD family protein n=1 Tax=Microbulbifer sp. ANSA001 TaxID=3243358 RepID=UPI0040418212
MNENIFQAPTSSLEVSEDEPNYELASTLKRFVNLIIDTIIYYLVVIVLMVVIVQVGGDYLLAGAWGSIFALVVMFLYYSLAEFIFGRTPGKLITRTRVVNFEGGKITMGQALGRSLIRFVPFEPFSFLGRNGSSRGWHDSWSKTRVISTK